MTKVKDGPIMQYLERTKLDEGTFNGRVTTGDVAATVVFVADILFGAIHDVAGAVENQSMAMKR